MKKTKRVRGANPRPMVLGSCFVSTLTVRLIKEKEILDTGLQYIYFSEVDVGAFSYFSIYIFFNIYIYQSYIGGLPPASALSFSHQFQFMNHVMAERYTCEKKSARRWREANPLSLVFKRLIPADASLNHQRFASAHCLFHTSTPTPLRPVVFNLLSAII